MRYRLVTLLWEMMTTMMLMNLRLAKNKLLIDLIGDVLICFVSPMLFKDCVLLGFMVKFEHTISILRTWDS